MAEGDGSKVTLVVATGLLALFGTVAGGVVEGFWQREVKLQEFQSDLILNALGAESAEDRESALRFIMDAGLISDAEISGRLRAILETEDVLLPRFGDAVRPREVAGAESAKEDAGLADDEAAGRFYALSGLIVRHGDIIDAVTPIFSEVSVGGDIGAEKVGVRYGGDGGGVTRLERPGHLISEVRLIRGSYFGATHIIHVEVSWRELTSDGLNPGTTVTSKRIGGGNYAKSLQPPIAYTAPDGHYISDLFVPPSLRHTSGELYLTDLIAEYRPFPKRG